MTERAGRGRRAALIALCSALALASCTQDQQPRSEPLDLAEERLAALAERADGFTSFTASTGGLSAVAAVDGEPTHWVLTPELREGQRYNLGTPSIPIQDVDITAMTQATKELAAQCGDANHLVETLALTPVATLTTLHCGEGDASALRAAEPTTVLLNGQPLPQFNGSWDAAEWAKLLDLVAVLSPQNAVEGIIINGRGDLTIDLADDASTNGCRPGITVPTDGTDLAWLCHVQAQFPALLGPWDGGSLAAAVDEVAATRDIPDGDDRAISIRPDRSGLDISVTRGTETAHAVVPAP